ncbi:hypothetical protein CK203_057129 [Vitis vinifera]|uniref:Uncharacterized protein n=1 Tax=Vitis vinifera TaxID=29760 RepID=A0A438GD99_VITVI|nr:hypothetical protein CK203_057129 [Vitis vinifera]
MSDLHSHTSSTTKLPPRQKPPSFALFNKQLRASMTITNRWFAVMLGLKINLEKSELIPIGKVSNLEDLVGPLGCKVGALPTIYLGLPLGAPFKCSRRATVRLEKIQRDLLWGGGALEQKPHLVLVKWFIVRLDKQKEGLGIRALSILNEALLGKWSWRFVSERDILWKRAIRGRWKMFKIRIGFKVGFENKLPQKILELVIFGRMVAGVLGLLGTTCLETRGGASLLREVVSTPHLH